MSGNWLSHLQNCIPRSVSADKISMYTIALEGWRRGLPLTFYTVKYGSKKEINYSFNYNGEDFPFAVSKGNRVTREAMRICKDKSLTKVYLNKANVPVPKGEKFDKQVQNQEVLEAAEKIGYPVVLKPTNANLGRGVIPNIVGRKELAESLVLVRNKLGYREVIVEQYIEGEEYRIYVIDGKVIAAMNRIPANIIGDGKHTISQLISLKNKERVNNPNLKGRSIKIDNETKKYIREANYTLSSVLDKNEQLILRKNSNISSGGEPIDVTEELTEEMKNVAIGALKAIPGLEQAGIDVIINKEKNTGTVIEINTRPGIGGHLYPISGKARDIPKEIINYYFPDRKELAGNNIFYFDYYSIKSILNSGIAKEVNVPAIPLEKIKAQKFELIGTVNSLSYKRWMQRIALSHHINGSIRTFTDKKAGWLVAAGTTQNMKKFIANVQKYSPEKIKIKLINKEYSYPIKVGFEIRKNTEYEQ